MVVSVVEMTGVQFPDPTDCHACGVPAVRRLGAQGFCSAHLEELFAGFDPAVFAYRGIGHQNGPLHPEFGPQFAELACNACTASWVGIPGEQCSWCQRSYDALLEHQAQLALTPPDVDLDDAARDHALEAWEDRLWVAVQAGVVEPHAAARIVRREERRGGAA